MEQHDHGPSLFGFEVTLFSFDQESFLVDEGGAMSVGHPDLGICVLVGDEGPVFLDWFEELVDVLSHFYKEDGRGGFKVSFFE